MFIAYAFKEPLSDLWVAGVPAFDVMTQGETFDEITKMLASLMEDSFPEVTFDIDMVTHVPQKFAVFNIIPVSRPDLALLIALKRQMEANS